MKRIEWMVGFIVCFLSVVAATNTPSHAAEPPAKVVGRIFDAEGDLLRYVPEEEDWVAVVRDAPFGEEDTLFAGREGMAELIVPNGTWVRLGNNTQIQCIALDADLSEMDVASGTARFYNKSFDTVVKATSPFGYVLADPGTVFDLYVGDDSVEVVAVRGNVSFVHSASGAKYDVAPGSPSILADQQQVSSGDGTVDPGWSRWNMDRDSFWAAKARVRGRSAEVLPPSLQDEAFVLEENGRWERVPYEGAERWFWRPRVGVGWSPFTVGRWTDWDGDQTWIPEEPFGYVTHHYGNWVYVGNDWYWAPPVASVRVGLPLLDVGFFWYPGRVSWIHRGTYVGWVPLAPGETYYSRRRWGGPHVVVVNTINIKQINVNIRSYVYANHAIVIDQNDFYRVNDYRKVRISNVNRAAIIKNYHSAPVVNNTVINNYTAIRQRYNYTNVTVKEKPHSTVVNRIQHNEKIIHGGRKEKPSVLQARVKALPQGRVNREARIEAPKVTNYLVPANEVNRPKAKMKLPQRELKRNATGAQPAEAGRPERVAPAKPRPPEQARPEPRAPEGRVAPGRKLRRPEQPGGGPEQVTPAKPPRPGQPRAADRPVPPPAQPEQPERARPEPWAPEKLGAHGKKPGRPEPTSAGPERAGSAKPAQPEQPRIADKPVSPRGRPEQAPLERMAPAKPGQPGSARPERGAPEKPGPRAQKPGQPEQPSAGPERNGRVKPGQPGEPKGTGKVAPQAGGRKPAPSEQVAPAEQGQAERATPGHKKPNRPRSPDEEPGQPEPSTPSGN